MQNVVDDFLIDSDISKTTIIQNLTPLSSA